MALDAIQLSKLKVIHNLDAVDMNMQKLVSIQKTMMGLLIFGVVALVLNIVFIIIFVYFQYRPLIKVVDDNASMTPGAPGGLMTAMTCKFPVLAKLFGFMDSSYPIALLFCVQDPSLNAFFSQKPGEIMQMMWGMLQQGGGCGSGTQPVGIPGPSVLICCSLQQVLGKYPNISLCASPCNPYDSNQPLSYVSEGINSAMSGAMLGMQVGGPPGALIGALLMTGATIGLKVYSNSQTENPPCIS